MCCVPGFEQAAIKRQQICVDSNEEWIITQNQDSNIYLKTFKILRLYLKNIWIGHAGKIISVRANQWILYFFIELHSTMTWIYTVTYRIYQFYVSS